MRASWAETIMGFAVLAFAALMLTYALGVSGLRHSSGAYEVSALWRGGRHSTGRQGDRFRGQGGFGDGCDH
jgi:hypothetical protein